MEYQELELIFNLNGEFNLELLITYIINLKIIYNQTLFLLFKNGTEKIKLNLQF